MGSSSIGATPLLTAFRVRQQTRARTLEVGPAFSTFLLIMACLIPLSVCWYLVNAEPLYEVGSVEVTPPDVIAAIVIFAAFARALIRGFHRLPKRLFLALVFFFLSTLISALFAPDKLRAGAALVQQIEFGALAWAFSLIGQSERFRRFIHFVLAIFAVESLIACWQLSVFDTGYPSGTFLGHQQYAFYTTFSACMAFALLIQERARGKKFLYLIALSILVMGSLLGLERAPWLAFVITGVVSTAYAGRRKKALLIGLIAAILGSVVLVASVPRLRELVVSRIMEAQSESVGENSLLTRLLLWKVGLQLFLAHPIVGAGPKNFVNLVPHYLGSEEMMGNDTVHSVHNAWVQYLAEQGIIGFVSYAGFCWAVLTLGTRLLRQQIPSSAKSVSLAYLAYHVFWMMMLYSYYNKGEGHLHFTLIGLMAGISLRLKQENMAAPPLTS